jgi:hypothetical protein
METSTGGLHGACLKKDLVNHLGRYAVEADVREGRLTHFSKEVLVERSRAADLLTRAAAAILVAGPAAILTSHTAVHLYGCTAADSAPVHVLLPYKRRVRPRPGMVVHHSAWEPKQVESLYGMPVLGFDHALADMLCQAKSSTAFACLDQALALQPAEGRTSFRGRVAESVLSRGDKRGYRRATTLLELATGLAESPTASTLTSNVSTT